MGVFYSYEEKLKKDGVFLRIITIIKSLKAMENVEEKITTFKILTLSKVIFFAHNMTLSTEIFRVIEMIQNHFLRN